MEGQSREAQRENDSATCEFTRQGQVLRFGERLVVNVRSVISDAQVLRTH